MTAFHDSAVDRAALRAYRLARVQAQMQAQDVGGLLLYDPVNIRYALDSSNMQVWTLHNKARYAFVPASGKAILFDYNNCEHLSDEIDAIEEVRPARSHFYFINGSRSEEMAESWADEIADVMRERSGGCRRIACDSLDPLGTDALKARQLTLTDGKAVMEQARLIKSADEVLAMEEAIACCQEGMRRMQAALTPGITETKLWSILHQTNIEMGGEWIETRLCTSGPRTFPWFQECSNRVIEAGDMVSFDTDLIGPNGYCADISRSWICGDGPAKPHQRELYQIAFDQLHHNLAMVRPGLGFYELAQKSYKLPSAADRWRYSCVAHGVGLCDEYPDIMFPGEMEANAPDGELAPNMTLCFEALVGTPQAGEAVKLEQQVLITETGYRLLSTYPLGEARFLGRDGDGRLT